MPLRRLVVLAALAGALAFLGALLRPRPRPAGGAVGSAGRGGAAATSVPRPVAGPVASPAPAGVDVRDAVPVASGRRPEPSA